MVLAAGRGERLRPLTTTMPKPVLPVLGRAMIVQILAGLADRDLRDVTINLHHLPGVVRDVLGDGSELGLDALHYSEETALQGTAGGVRDAARFLRGDGPILVRNSDFLSDVDPLAVARAHRESDAAATLVLVPHRPGYTAVAVDADGRVLGFGDDGSIPASRGACRYLFAGLQVLDEGLIDRIPAAGPCDLVRHLYRDLAREGRVRAFLHDGFWWEFGNPETYLEGSLRLLDLDPAVRRAVADTDPVREIDGARVAVGPGADFHQGVEIVGRAAIGFASMIAEGTRVEDALVLPESWIGPGCSLRRAVVGPGCEVPAGTTLEDVLIGPAPARRRTPPAGIERAGSLWVRRLAPPGPR